jgi:hypothetical protein
LKRPHLRLLLAIWAFAGMGTALSQDGAVLPVTKFAFTSAMFADANRADALIAIKMLADLSLERLIRCSPDHLKSALNLVDQYQRSKGNSVSRLRQADSEARGETVVH